MDPTDYKDMKQSRAAAYPLGSYGNRSDSTPYSDLSPPPTRGWHSRESSENLMGSAAGMGQHARSISRESGASTPPLRQPTVPNVDGYRGRAY